MKFSYIVLILIVSAWPLYYLYQRQLGAVSFLLLALFFLYIALKEMKKLKQSESQEKIKRNNR